MAYPTPANINASAGFPEFLSYVNNVTNSWFSNMILIGFYVIILLVYSRHTDDWIAGFALAGFGTFLIALLFFMGSFITSSTFLLVIGFMLIGGLALFLRK